MRAVSVFQEILSSLQNLRPRLGFDAWPRGGWLTSSQPHISLLARPRLGIWHVDTQRFTGKTGKNYVPTQLAAGKAQTGHLARRHTAL